ncbi:MAG TPA: IS30 family transposase [Verrucomicrobiae bacterium]|nr:IS30 family transposase [Verrucomicrobiae bacterium]
MGQKYKQFSLEERCTLARLSQAGQKIRQIAAIMDRAPSTITRELVRDSGTQVGYQPVYAEQQAKSRRWRGSRLLRDADLQAVVLNRLGQGWSPAQVAGRLKKENKRQVISYESIYRFIDSQIRRTKDYSWRHYLPRGKSKRGWRGRKGGSPVDHIEGRVFIERRPAYIDKRRQPGHWEGDLMLFAKYGQAVLVTHERHSRLLLVTRQPSKAAEPVATKLTDLFRALPKTLRRTITFDNGTEFAYHHRLHKLSMRTFFCDTHSPWQKGGIENAIGRMRRNLPRKTDLATLDLEELDHRVATYNNTPRKCLGFKTPAAVFCEHLDSLHFKRECTFPPARE